MQEFRASNTRIRWNRCCSRQQRFLQRIPIMRRWFQHRCINSNKIKFIQLSMVDEEQVIAVIVLGGNVIKNKIIDSDEPIAMRIC